MRVARLLTLPLLSLSLLTASPLEAATAQPLTVVLDPGHGGTNAGAFGPEAGLSEKRLTLELCQRIAARLRWLVPGARVAMTRTRDEYLTLAERVRRANAQQAHLFLSLHANASDTRSRSGFETFILSRDASDREAARLAVLENSGLTGPRAPNASGTLRAILVDLQRGAAHAASLGLARTVQRRLAEVRGVERDQGIRQAPFDVLMGLHMPAVLIEVGYLDHPVEGPELAQAAVQDQIAAAIASAVRDTWLGRSAEPPAPADIEPRAGR